MLPHHRKNRASAIGLQTGQITPVSNFFCQENLTKSSFFLENRDTYKISRKMGKIDKSALAGALMLGGAMASQPALAENQDIDPVVTSATSQTAEKARDCVAFVKEQRALAKDAGIAMSRKDQKLLLLDCQGDELDKRIAEQELILKVLDEEIRQLDLRLDEQAQILDEQGRVLAKIVAINGQLIIRAQQADESIAVKLQEADQILKRLATS